VSFLTLLSVLGYPNETLSFMFDTYISLHTFLEGQMKIVKTYTERVGERGGSQLHFNSMSKIHNIEEWPWTGLG